MEAYVFVNNYTRYVVFGDSLEDARVKYLNNEGVIVGSVTTVHTADKHDKPAGLKPGLFDDLPPGGMYC